ncbi:hypothetical protein M3B43_12040 [Nesterenkonia massiliensis]|uniref:Uncharacterized protein n=1 Tax=Nesterenkonia massiliensis TaxID=1232429 RepID=A0ABT2HTJ4_9MICC|nr:hypothetical protein [Nesterenkonia massiliensis]MCT1608028.1 hypothetical protein [Nesterenkonia massiliensis]
MAEKNKAERDLLMVAATGVYGEAAVQQARAGLSVLTVAETAQAVFRKGHQWSTPTHYGLFVAAAHIITLEVGRGPADPTPAEMLAFEGLRQDWEEQVCNRLDPVLTRLAQLIDALEDPSRVSPSALAADAIAGAKEAEQ